MTITITTGFAPRRPVTVTPIAATAYNGSGAIELGVVEFEFEQSQGLLTPDVQVPGAHYTYDQLGTAAGFKRTGKLSIRYTVLATDPTNVDDAVDEVCTLVPAMGLVKVWYMDRTGATRWRYARATAVPALNGKVDDVLTRTVGLDFRLQSDTFSGAGVTTDSHHLSATSTSYSVTVGGLVPIFNAKLILRGTWAAVVQVINATTGYRFSYNNDTGAAPTDWVKFDAGANRVFRSVDGGANYVGADSKITRGPMQQQLMVLAAGANALTVVDGATPDSYLDVIYTAAY